MMKKLSYTLLIAFLLTGLMGCGDNSTGVKTDTQPPQIPDFTKYAKPDISFFKNNKPPSSSSDYDHYYDARLGATFFRAIFLGIVNQYLDFLPENNGTAQFNNGIWTWSYNHSIKEKKFSVRLTAKELGSSVNWALYYSYDDGQGNSVENYKLMKGMTSNYGSSGSWTLNNMVDSSAAETLFIKTTWENPSTTKQSVTYKVYSQGIMSAIIHYEQDEAIHTFSIHNLNDSQSKQTIYWNTNTHEGYNLVENGQKECWDSNFKDVPCN